jgi:class 3 adenylate cyclase
MAIDMQAEVQRLAVDWHARGYSMGFGVGIAKGEATVGRVGYEGRHDYTAIGTVVNLASRLCSSAEDGQILLEQTAATAVAGEVAVVFLGTRILKGFAKPVPTHAVMA